MNPIFEASQSIRAAQHQADKAHAAGAKRDDYLACQVGALQAELRKLGAAFAAYQGHGSAALNPLGGRAIVMMGRTEVMIEYHDDGGDVVPDRAWINGDWCDDYTLLSAYAEAWGEDVAAQIERETEAA